jgi:Spy/CpxP family protein refolding chaperone
VNFRRSITASLGAAFALALVLAPAASAQTGANLTDAVELTRKQIETERQAIVAENLNLTDAESAKFWPLYKEYMAERSAVGTRRMNLIGDYAKNYKTMTDQKASDLLKEAFATDESMLKIKKSWAKKMGKEVSPITTARFFQIENQLDLIVNASIADEVPLMIKGKPAVAEPVSAADSK